MLVHRKKIHAAGSSDSFDRRDKSSHDRTELDTLSRSQQAIGLSGDERLEAPELGIACDSQFHPGPGTES